MDINFSSPMGTQPLKNGNVLHEHQIGDTLIYIEFTKHHEMLDFHQKVKRRYLSDYKIIPQINEFSQNIFLKKFPKYQSLITNVKSTCLMVYSYRYFIDQDYVEYDCFINHDFIDLIDDPKMYDELYEILENEAVFLKYKDGIIEEDI